MSLVKTATASESVAARLRQAIAKGELTPNQRLIEVDLAAEMGTNRANIRTALALLEQEGLVSREPNRGARVRLVSDKEAIEIAETRGALETLIAREAARRCTVDDAEILRRLLAEMQTAYSASDLISMSGLNEKLHREIRRMAANATASAILEGLKSRVVRQQYRAILLPGRAERSLAEHGRIVEAICANDAESAGRAMADHLGRVTDAIKEAIQFSRLLG